MCTARSGSARKFLARAAVARSNAAESGPPLKATTRPLASGGTHASSAACKAAEGLTAPVQAVDSTFAKRTEAAQARLPRIQQLRDRFVAQLDQVLHDALLHRFRHELRIAMRPAMRFLQHFIDQPKFVE